MEQRVILFVLLWCWCWTRGTGARVLPPENVTLLCHNMQNTLHWTYTPPTDGVKFKVDVLSTQRKPVLLWVESPATSIDLSEFSEPDNEYMVQVSAVRDSEESEPVPEDGIEYSYFQNSGTPLICNVDFPLVDVTRDDQLLHFSFTHPGLLYPPSGKHANMRRLHRFHYHVQLMNQDWENTYSCSESLCRGKLPILDAEKSYCLNIYGEMRKMSVQPTKTYCTEPQKAAGISVLFYVLPLVVAGGALLVGVMVFVKQTRPMTLDTKALDFTGRRSVPQQDQTSLVTSDCSSVHVERPTRVTVLPPNLTSPSAPLLTQTQDTSSDSSTGSEDMRLPLGIPGNENEPESEGAAGEQEGALGDGYTEGKYLDGDDDDEDEEEEPQSHAYEPHNMTVLSHDSD
ncbi:hypothetical protein NQD34_011475 [Periophthalmus magnuspinnatus]|uniref:interferon gamma receptor 1-like n=1 Tax=Periophthalmus magnuspinnatus TaxID=409849 RepID=UPI0022C5A95C|nr:interferon gamma receptor 1-like [Periophthalmus magnuspinnatus]KAJ0005261.1 hypothetical protein NQD34_011475 [Periophthalmus magnuspinnatus]